MIYSNFRKISYRYNIIVNLERFKKLSKIESSDTNQINLKMSGRSKEVIFMVLKLVLP